MSPTAPAAVDSVADLGPNPPIRVLVLETSPTLSLRANGSWRLTGISGEPIAQLPADTDTTLTLHRGGHSHNELPGRCGNHHA